MNNIPETIWLNLGTNGTGEDPDYRELSEVTWSEEQIFSDDVQYFRKNQWISVNDELPNDRTFVVAHSPNGRIDILSYDDNAFMDELWQAHCVDYWMPIPALPKIANK